MDWEKYAAEIRSEMQSTKPKLKLSVAIQALTLWYAYIGILGAVIFVVFNLFLTITYPHAVLVAFMLNTALHVLVPYFR